jgi:hypothetical protein
LEFHGGSVSVFPRIKKWTMGAMRKNYREHKASFCQQADNKLGRAWGYVPTVPAR